MMRRNLLFIAAVFCLFFATFALQKPCFWFYSPEFRETIMQGHLWQIVLHVFVLDLLGAFGFTLLPGFFVWLGKRLSSRSIISLLNVYFTLTSILVATGFTWMAMPFHPWVLQLLSILLYATLLLAIYLRFLLPLLFPEQRGDTTHTPSA